MRDGQVIWGALALAAAFALRPVPGVAQEPPVAIPPVPLPLPTPPRLQEDDQRARLDAYPGPRLDGRYVLVERNDTGPFGARYLLLPTPQEAAAHQGWGVSFYNAPMRLGSGSPIFYAAVFWRFDCERRTARAEVNLLYGRDGKEIQRLPGPDHDLPVDAAPALAIAFGLACQGQAPPPGEQLVGLSAVAADADTRMRRP